ncbi:tetratricopeptide repeat protein [Bermanella marisrubri]|uniref:TPR domain protein n=1 Tax=Bermanella marisrubri TaxID=207949 RepID=Q1N3M2_9GAMM|nr:tetratricopeptide repeat protein [Bermanella marisrubri]EAT12852.1 TPR domain protein [Oceanobacter sp. RED65] [Bermanella marisrubri]QIZ83173.1 tetratricopeptide repeat protein [Bermanella marisrubri]
MTAFLRSKRGFIPFLLLFALNTNAETASKDANQDYGVNTFYSLLVAEFAGQRQLYDVALGNYLLEAHRTQDPEVTARATQIAQYIRADQAALDAATLWVKLAPEDPTSQQALTVELLKAARFSEASLHLQKALNLEPDLNLNFISQEGVELSVEGRQLWIDALSPLTSMYPDNISLMFNIASLLQQQESYGLALDYSERIIKAEQDFYPAWSLKARLEVALDHQEKALKTVNQALKRFSGDKNFLVLRARLYIKIKDIQKARDDFLYLSETYPRDAHILLPLALTHIELEEYAAAEHALQRLLRLNQLTDEAHYYLGRIKQYDDDQESALHHYLEMEKGREFLAAQTAIIQIYVQNEEFDKALSHIRTQRTRHSEHKQAFFLMEVELLNRAGRYDEAMNVLNTALSDYADSTDLRYSRAMVSEKLGDLAQLEKDLEYIIDRDPDNATALNALGYTLADRTSRLQEALTYIEKALQLAPKDPAIIDSLGWVYFRMGRYQEALELLQQAYELYPDPEVAAHLGEVLWTMNKTDEAKRIWQQGLQKQPTNKIIRDTLKRLDVRIPE